MRRAVRSLRTLVMGRVNFWVFRRRTLCLISCLNVLRALWRSSGDEDFLRLLIGCIGGIPGVVADAGDVEGLADGFFCLLPALLCCCRGEIPYPDVEDAGVFANLFIFAHAQDWTG